jgi:hypothetical protein
MTSRADFCTKTVPPRPLCTIGIRAIESLSQIGRKLKVFWLQLASIGQSFRNWPHGASGMRPENLTNVSAISLCSDYNE